MHRAALFGIATLLFTAAAAAPVKRDDEVVTVTEIDTVIEMVTATVWVDPTDAPAPVEAQHSAYHDPASTTSVAAYYAPPASPASSSSSTSSTSSTFSTSSTSPSPPPPPPAPAVAAPETTSTSTSTTPAPAPEPTTSTSVYVAPEPTSTSVYVAPEPTSTSVYVAPEPTSEYVPPPAPISSTTSDTPVAAPTTTAQAPAAATGASSSPSGTTYKGEITYYAVGLGSCGNTNTDSEMVVAMSAAMMNKATMCGQEITLSYNGVTQKATVVDTCPGCSAGSLDLSPTLFQTIAPNGDGRVHGVEWWFN